MSNLQLLPEVWLPIAGYEKYYEISNHGKVRKPPRKLKDPKFKGAFTNYKILVQKVNAGGYSTIGLSKKDKRKWFMVHRIVAAHFVGEIPAGYEINHKDLIKANNYFGNLEIVTKKENVQHARKMYGKDWAVNKVAIEAKCMKTGNTIIYESMADAGRDLLLNTGLICKAVQSGKAITKGFTFTKIAS